jgi:hypothetical protein
MRFKHNAHSVLVIYLFWLLGIITDPCFVYFTIQFIVFYFFMVDCSVLCSEWKQEKN